MIGASVLGISLKNRTGHSQIWMFLLVSSSLLYATNGLQGSVKISVFYSPALYLKPGSVENNYYFDIPFPRGHIALKSFDGEIIDENQNPIPLHETYLHHWAVYRYYGAKGSIDHAGMPEFRVIRNSGTCINVGQYFGLGSEIRKTNTWVPDPYGIEIGDPAEIPEGYEERWMLNVHSIDTRGVEDRLGCTECKCSLYNVSVDEYQRPLAPGYLGGLRCCYDKTQCPLREGFNGRVRKLYLRYTVKWTEWKPNIVPVKIYIFDVTDTEDRPSSLDGANAGFSCKVEYTVPRCSSEDEANGNCVDSREAKAVIPHGGDIVYGVAHQHTGGIGSALYGQDGRLLCTSYPIYGKGEEPGDEAGYIVGMSTCYPKPGTVAIKDVELVSVVSNYSNAQMHTGVMGLFYILVAEPQPKLSTIIFHTAASKLLAVRWWVVLVTGGIMAVVASAIFVKRNESEGYQTIRNSA